MAEKVNKIIIDYSVLTIETGVTGANKTDYHIKNVVPGRIFQSKERTLLSLISATRLKAILIKAKN